MPELMIDDIPPTPAELDCYPLDLLSSMFLELFASGENDMQLVDVNRALIKRILQHGAEFDWSMGDMHEEVILMPFRELAATNGLDCASPIELILAKQERRFRKAFETLMLAIDTIHREVFAALGDENKTIQLENVPEHLVLNVQNAYMHLFAWRRTISRLKPEDASSYVKRLLDFEIVVYAERQQAGVKDKHNRLGMLCNLLHFVAFGMLTFEELAEVVPRIKAVIYKYNLRGSSTADDETLGTTALMDALDLNVSSRHPKTARFYDAFPHFSEVVLRDVFNYYI